MKSILFLLKFVSILTILSIGVIFIIDLIRGYPEFEMFWAITLIAFFTFYFHEWGQKYKWEDDYWVLFLKTGYKKYSSNLKKSKARMKDELNDD